MHLNKKKLYFLVSNSLHQDQRLHRIASTLSQKKYEVCIICINNTKRANYVSEHFDSESISTWFTSGFLFYFEMNFRFLFLLLFRNDYEGVVANDIDTALAAKLSTVLRRKTLVVDLHEYYPEAPEVRERLFVKTVWSLVSKLTLGSSRYNYTVNESLSKIFNQHYNQEYLPIYNFPIYKPILKVERVEQSLLKLVYVGAVNKGRGLIPLLYSMIELEQVLLTIIGEGDEMEGVIKYVKENNLDDKVEIIGFLDANKLHDEILKYDVGINLLDASSKSYYYSSANKFFDYAMAGLPSISMAFPEYIAFNEKFETAILIPNLSIEEITKAITQLRNDRKLMNRLHLNCIQAKEEYNWESQSEKLISFYDNIFNP